MTEQQTKLIDRIKKLMALAGNNPNQEEAALAMAKAQELLTEHKLSVSDFDTTEKQEDYVNNEHDIGGNRNSVNWRRSLIGVLAKGNFCYVLCKTWTTHIHMIGKPSDQEIVKYLFDYVVGEIPRMFSRYCASEGLLRKPDLHSYAQGVTVAIRDRMAEQRRAAQHSATGQACTALVVREDRSLQIATKKFYPRTGRSYSSRSINGDAYSAGRRDGANLSLNRGVSQKPSGHLN